MPALLIAALVVFLEGLSFGLSLPVIPALTEHLDGHEFWTGLMFALATAPRVLLAPLWGKMADRSGRRPALILAGFGTMIASLIWASVEPLGTLAASGLIWLLVARTLTGVFSAQSVLALAIASDVSTPEKRVGSMGILGACFGLAFTIGPALGGVLGDKFGLAHVGYFAAGSQTISILLVIGALKETRPTLIQTALAPARSLLRLGSAPLVREMLATCFLSTVAYSAMMPTYQPLTKDWYGFSVTQAGYALACFGLIGSFVQGGLVRPMVKRAGPHFTALAGLLLLTAALAWLGTHPGLSGFWIATSLAAIGTGLSVPAVSGLLSLAADEQEQGAIHGLNQSVTSLGRAAGYLLAGSLYFKLGPQWCYSIAAIGSLLALPGLLTHQRYHRRKAALWAPASADSAK